MTEPARTLVGRARIILQPLRTRWTRWLGALRVLAAARRVSEVRAGPAQGIRLIGWEGRGYAAGSCERPVQDALAHLLSPGDVFYDIGAHAGFFSMLACRQIGLRGQVFAFEPIRRLAKVIRHEAVVNGFPNITVIEAAVSDRSGRGKLLVTACTAGASLSTTSAVPPDVVAERQVRTICIDEELEHGRLRPPSVVKIDVEGVEVQVLRGMIRTIRRFRPRLLWEVDGASEADCDRRMLQLSDLVRDLTYRVEVLPPAYPDIRWAVKHAVASPV